LLAHLLALLRDPRESSDNGEPDGVVVQLRWSCDTNPAKRRIHREVEVLDVLPNDVDLEVVDANDG
jgi:hypothetical protein